MISCTVPPQIRKVADRLKDIFFSDSCNYNVLCVLLCFHLFGLSSLSEAVRSLGWSLSVSSIQNKMHSFQGNRLMRRARASITRKFKGEMSPEDWCYAIDDTANPKFGKKIFGCSRWGHGGGVYQGQRVLVLVLVNKVKGYALPVNFAFVKKQDEEGYLSGMDLSVELLKAVLAEGFPKLPVAFDSWFDSTDLMKKLDDLGVTFCIHAKMSRKIKTNPSPKAFWVSWTIVLKNLIRLSVKLEKSEHQRKRPKTKYLQELFVFIKKRKTPLRACAVYNHVRDGTPFAIYLTNDLKMSAFFLYELSRKRWLIEELFRNLKQNFSFGKLPCTGQVAAELSICVPFLLLVYMKTHPDEWNQKADQPKTVGTIVEQIKAENFNKALSFLMRNPTHQIVQYLKSRRSPDRVNKKPINSVADEVMAA